MGHPNEPSSSSGDATEHNSVNAKKRLSRREQKARKKQRKQQRENDIPSAACANLKRAPEKDQQHITKELLTRESKEKDNSSAADPWKACEPQPNIPYVPTPLPNGDSNNHDNKIPSKKSKTLGKWFPNASVFKSQPSSSTNCTILLFYQYKSPIVWPDRKVALLMQYLQAVAEARPLLGGRLRVAPEGINATLSCGDAPDGTNGRTILEHFTKDLIHFDAIFEQTDFKYLPAKADRHFKDLKILPVQELVFYGLQEAQAPLCETGVHLDAKDFHSMLQDTSKETVVVDVRNHYEAALGRFDGQEKIPGAAIYTDPLMRKSTDFPEWVEKAADDLKGKRVMLYCTGGVRCERASAYLKKTMGDSLEGIYQLKGGIERYLQAFPDGGHWRGSNFVFDKREAVSVDNPNGHGGVIKKKQQPKNADTKCCLCDKPWDRYVGKKKCDCCGVPVLMCDTCMSTKKRKDSDDQAKMARCPLCVDQNITVPLEEVEYTNNGVKSKCNSEQGKAAPSVLKWGGGHASEKKLKRRKSRGKEREKPRIINA
jgi:predicted sulfurtransferase